MSSIHKIRVPNRYNDTCMVQWASRQEDSLLWPLIGLGPFTAYPLVPTGPFPPHFKDMLFRCDCKFKWWPNGVNVRLSGCLSVYVSPEINWWLGAGCSTTSHPKTARKRWSASPSPHHHFNPGWWVVWDNGSIIAHSVLATSIKCFGLDISIETMPFWPIGACLQCKTS